jgi:hypothetical protein
VPDSRSGTLTRDVPQAVYAPDAGDPWNRIFHGLFTRTVRTRLSGDFPEGGPFTPVEVMGFSDLPVSKGFVERVESGDRAIEPLYPAFLSADGPFQALTEPRYTRLEGALADAVRTAQQRPPLARALMQSDAWAAHDVLARGFDFEGAEGPLRRGRRDRLLSLLARFIKELALTPAEIDAFPDNYAQAATSLALPDLFAPGGGWLEVEWFPEREHDRAADYRRAARVFIKPASPPADPAPFLNGLPHATDLPRKLDAVALVLQDLLINHSGKVVPSRLTYEVQVRRFVKDGEGKLVRTELSQYEISRRLLLADRGAAASLPGARRHRAICRRRGMTTASRPPTSAATDGVGPSSWRSAAAVRPVMGSTRQRS